MARRRLAVALLIPQPLATEIDGIRRACGDPRRGRIAPHITLVPPVNVRDEDIDEVVTICREAAGRASVLRLVLGTPSSFAPDTPLAWLSVSGDIEALAALRQRLETGPLARPAEHEFVPHVTISAKVAPPRLAAMLVALTDFAAALTVDRLHVLENRQLPDGRWGWLPLTDVTFGRVPVVGVGGLALELSAGSMPDPDAEALLGSTSGRSGRLIVVTARRDRVVVGVALGSASGRLARLDELVVADESRRQGVGSHLLARFTAEAVDRGCELAIHVAGSDVGLSQLCRRRGWTTDAEPVPGVAPTLVRLLGARSS